MEWQTADGEELAAFIYLNRSVNSDEQDDDVGLSLGEIDPREKKH